MFALAGVKYHILRMFSTQKEKNDWNQSAEKKNSRLSGSLVWQSVVVVQIDEKFTYSFAQYTHYLFFFSSPARRVLCSCFVFASYKNKFFSISRSCFVWMLVSCSFRVFRVRFRLGITENSVALFSFLNWYFCGIMRSWASWAVFYRVIGLFD